LLPQYAYKESVTITAFLHPSQASPSFFKQEKTIDSRCYADTILIERNEESETNRKEGSQDMAGMNEEVIGAPSRRILDVRRHDIFCIFSRSRKGRDHCDQPSPDYAERFVVGEWKRTHPRGSNLIAPDEALPARAPDVPPKPIEI
jgi:hypothetical protein